MRGAGALSGHRRARWARGWAGAWMPSSWPAEVRGSSCRSAPRTRLSLGVKGPGSGRRRSPVPVHLPGRPFKGQSHPLTRAHFCYSRPLPNCLPSSQAFCSVAASPGISLLGNGVDGTARGAVGARAAVEVGRRKMRAGVWGPGSQTPAPPERRLQRSRVGNVPPSLLLLSRFSRVRLCDSIDGSPPGFSVPGILQARILEWVAISFSIAGMHAKSLQSCPTLCDPMDSGPPGSSV